MERQNKDYFEAKAKDLMEKRKHDQVSFTSANLLFKSLNMNINQFAANNNKFSKQALSKKQLFNEQQDNLKSTTTTDNNNNKDKSSLPFAIKKSSDSAALLALPN